MMDIESDNTSETETYVEQKKAPHLGGRTSPLSALIQTGTRKREDDASPETKNGTERE